MNNAAASESVRRINKQHLHFETDGGVAQRAAIGLIVLATDQTMEHEFRQLLAIDGVAFYENRIYNSSTVTPDTLRAMDPKIAPAAELILPNLPLDVVAFGCTSASMLLGEQRIFDRIHEARAGVACTTPITAAFAAFSALDARRIAVLTPYRDDINQALRRYIEERGYPVPVMGSFNEEDDTKAARIGIDYIRDAAIDLGKSDDVDAVFVSCTSLRLATVAAEVERETGKPVTSSNHALAWHCLRLAGVNDSFPEFGQLFTHTA